jgi:hypothetical protein
MVACVCACAFGATARAGESEALIKKGIELRRKGHDEQALELFKRAHDIDHGARSLAQMGFAEQALGIWVDAETHINAALGSASEPWIVKNRSVIQEALALVVSHLGSLEVWGTPAGAEVLIGGKLAGVLPLTAPLRATAGTVEIRVRASGFVELARVVDVPATRTARERFELPKKAPLNLTVAESPQPATRAAAESRMVDIHSEAGAPIASGHPIWKRWWFWTAMGGVVICAGATVYILRRPSDCPVGMCTTITP